MLQETRGLALRAREGDPEALEELLDRLRTRLLYWVGSRLGARLRSRMEAEDAVQEILLSLSQDLPSFRGHEAAAFRSWLFRLAENRLRSLHRDAMARKRQTTRLPERTPPPGPATRAALREADGRLATALMQLGESHREVIRLRRLEERTTAETASILGRSEGAVRVLLLRAMRELKRTLERQGGS